MVVSFVSGATMTTSSWAGETPPAFNFGRVVSSTLAAIGGQFPALFLLSLIFVGGPQLVIAFLPKELALVGLGIGLVVLIFRGAACRITYNHLLGKPITIREATGEALGRFGSLWGVGIILNLGEALGLLLLIVPGVILMAGWMCAYPIMVAENRTTFESLDRSWRLTQRSRWPLVGLLGLFVLAALVVFGVLIGIAEVFQTMLPQIGTTALVFVATPLAIVLLEILAMAGVTAAYVELKRNRDGLLGEEVASIFA
jgi:hypothetical protein